ncbi:unnamed protein product [Paramecium pentaurelia]|uniref:Protein kinase domain-containing protein n=1 Tax=Paramecium pentaurelia TaxID=43138 RepID=A0A8S1SNY0_9CILI|nr:unnamed protein product [Paramecium pentaurelia]
MNVINNYTIHKEIGKGATGKVYHVTDEKNIQYALKVQHHLTESEKKMNEQIKEIKFQNVINTYDQFQYQGIIQCFCVIMDFCNQGDLYEYLNKYRFNLNIQQKQNMLFQIAFGIWEIHQLNIIHRDIKPQNILLQCFDQMNVQLKICDLGLSKLQENQNLNTVNVGTPYYMAPELIDFSQKKGIYDKSVDIWAFGALIYDFFSNYQLFYGLQIYQIFDQIKQAKNLNQKLRETINDPLLLNIAISCLSYEPSKRPDIEQILLELNQPMFQYQQKIFNGQNQRWLQNKNQDLFQPQVQDQFKEQYKNQQKIEYQKANQVNSQIQNQDLSQNQLFNQKSKNHIKNQVRLRCFLSDQALIEQLCIMIEEGNQKDEILKHMNESLRKKLQAKLHQSN